MKIIQKVLEIKRKSAHYITDSIQHFKYIQLEFYYKLHYRVKYNDVQLQNTNISMMYSKMVININVNYF